MHSRFDVASSRSTERSHLRLVSGQQTERPAADASQQLVSYSDWHDKQLAIKASEIAGALVPEIRSWLDWRVGFECSRVEDGLVRQRDFTRMLDSVSIQAALAGLTRRLSRGALEPAASPAVSARQPSVEFRDLPDVLVSVHDASRILGLGHDVIMSMVHAGALPRPFGVFSGMYWRGSALCAAFEAAQGLRRASMVRRVWNGAEVAADDPRCIGWRLAGATLTAADVAGFLAVYPAKVPGLVRSARIPPPLTVAPGGPPLWSGDHFAAWIGGQNCRLVARDRLLRKVHLWGMLGLSDLRLAQLPWFNDSLAVDEHPRWRMSTVLAWLDGVSSAAARELEDSVCNPLTSLSVCRPGEPA